MAQLQVLIADDSEFMRIAYKRILEGESDIQVVAMASNGEEAVQKSADVAPDVAILDVRMPWVDGLQVAHEIRKQHPGTAIVVISAYDDLAFVADLMRNGVEGKAYLLKHSIFDITGLVRIVESVYRGETILDSGIIQRMARLFCKHSELLNTDLTGVEQDILGLMAEGYDDQGICQTLHLDGSRLQTDSESLYGKLGLLGGTVPQRRIMAVRAFVSQIHKVPLSNAYNPVS